MSGEQDAKGIKNTEEYKALQTKFEALQAEYKTLQEESSDLSNADLKKDPTVKRVTAELKEMRDWKTNKEAEEAKAKADKEKADQDAAIKAAEEAKDFEKAEALRKQNEKDAAAAKEIQNLKLKLALSNKGFIPRGVDLLSGEYTEAKGTIEEYAEAVLKDEANKLFLTGDNERKKKNPPGKTTTNDLSGQLTNEEIRALKRSDKIEDRRKGQKYLEDYWDEHGSLPPGYKETKR